MHFVLNLLIFKQAENTILLHALNISVLCVLHVLHLLKNRQVKNIQISTVKNNVRRGMYPVFENEELSSGWKGETDIVVIMSEDEIIHLIISRIF